MSTFLARIGAFLTSPRAAIDGTLAHPSPGAVADAVWWCIAAKLVAGEVVGLLRAFYVARELGVGPALSTVSGLVMRVLPDVIAVSAAGFFLSAVLGKRPGGRYAYDLGAAAWIPYFSVGVAAAVAFTLLQRPVPRVVEWATQGVGITWGIALWALGLRRARALRDAT